MWGTMFGDLDGKMVCVGSVVIKRRQELSMEKAEKASGILVDLPPNALEGYALELLLKRIGSATDKQFHIAADGDLKVNNQSTTSLCHQNHNVIKITMSPKSQCHQNHYVTKITMSPKSLCHQDHYVTKITMSPRSLCHQDHYVTKITMSPKSLCHQNHYVTKLTMSPRSLCHQIV